MSVRLAIGLILIFVLGLFSVGMLTVLVRRLYLRWNNLDIVLSSSPDMYFLVDRKGRFIYVNPAGASMMNLTTRQMIGKSWSNFALLPDTIQTMRVVFEECLAAKQSKNIDMAFPDSVSERYFHCIASPVFTAKQVVKFILISMRDISDRRQAEMRANQQSAYLQQIIDINPNMIFIKDAAGRYVMGNKALSLVLGKSIESILGKTDIEINNKLEEAQAYRQDDLDVIRTGKELIIPEEPQTCSDGSLRWLQTVKQPIVGRDGQPGYVLGVATDITRRRFAERELARSNEQLKEFAYVASHDLKEPLRTVTSYLQLLEKHSAGSMDDRGKKYMQSALAGADQMRQLIEDLLVYSRVGTAGKPFQQVDFGEVLAGVLKRLEFSIQESKAEVQVGRMPLLYADPQQMAQVFQNLIGNALKFHGVQPPIVQIDARQDGSEWLFLVRDNGIGIEPRFYERIFVIFQRLHTRNEYPGTGIGLAVCKNIIQRHGGRIWVESQPDKGSTFFFTIPSQLNLAVEQVDPQGEGA